MNPDDDERAGRDPTSPMDATSIPTGPTGRARRCGK
jgi:hypothetical protein